MKCLFRYVAQPILLDINNLENNERYSSKTLARRLKELEKDGILERQSYNEIIPRVEYKLTKKGQELVESIINLIQ